MTIYLPTSPVLYADHCRNALDAMRRDRAPSLSADALRDRLGYRSASDIEPLIRTLVIAGLAEPCVDTGDPQGWGPGACWRPTTAGRHLSTRLHYASADEGDRATGFLLYLGLSLPAGLHDIPVTLPGLSETHKDLRERADAIVHSVRCIASLTTP